MKQAGIDEWPVEDLDLTVRTWSCLKREGVDTVGQLAAMSEEDLLSLRNVGPASASEIRSRLLEHGYE